MHPNTQLLFVYGSLLSGFKSPAYEYIFQHFNFLGEGKVKGTIYDLGEYAVGTNNETGRFIKGELYEIKHPHEWSFILAQLDDYEGLNPDDEGIADFKRSVVEVTLNDGSTKQAWIYWFIGDINNRPIVPLESMIEYWHQKKQ